MAKQDFSKYPKNNSAYDIGIEKALPSNIEAERYILGAIILENQNINLALEQLKPDDYFLAAHRKIYEKMQKLTQEDRGIDPLTLQEELRRAGELDMVGGAAYIASLFEGVPRFSKIENYIQIVKDRSLLRKLIITSNHIMTLCFDDEEEARLIVDKATKEILSLSEEGIKKGFEHVGDVSDRLLEIIEKNSGRNEIITGISTGFHDLDYMTSGLQRGDLLIIAARPSMGKTAFSLNIAQNAALKQQVVKEDGEKAVIGFFSLEMSNEQLVSRLLCSNAAIDAHRLRTGMLNKENWKALAKAVGELSEAKIFLDDTPGISTIEMRAKCRRLKHEQKGLDLVIVDYLQLMSGRGRTESRQLEVSQISRDLKILAKELDVPLIALSQLSRAPEARTGNHKPQLSDLRDSGCLAGDTLITLADTGQQIPIRDLVGKSGFRVWALNEQTMKIESAVVSNAFSTGIKPVYKLTTRLGRTIRATANHKFRAFGEWKRLDEFVVGEQLALPDCRSSLYKHNLSHVPSYTVAEVVCSDTLKALANNDVYWDQVLSIEPDGEAEVFDLTVPVNHNFVASLVFSHNSIEQDADVVMFIYRDEVYKPETEKQNIAEIIIGKQRNGPIGTVELVFIKEQTKFSDKAYNG